MRLTTSPGGFRRAENLIAYRQAPRSPSTIRLTAAALSALCFARGPTGAQTLSPGYTTPPSIAYGELYRDVELASLWALFLFRCQIAARCTVSVDCVA